MIDDQVDRVLAALRDSGLEDNTIIIFTSDHGELLGDHGLLFKGPHHYDCLLRVPTLIRWPGTISPGTQVDELVEFIDLSATILELAGIEVPVGMQGRSILPMLLGGPAESRDSVLVERQDLYWNLDLRTLRTTEWKLNYYRGRPFGELYDLKNDPNEFINLWNDPGYNGVKQDLTCTLLDRILTTADLPPEATAVT